jgi:hypothetical protein
MAVTIRGVGTIASNTAAGSPIVPGLPTGTSNDDILVVIVETGIGETISIANWTQAPNSPVDSQNVTNQCRLHVWWKRANGTDTCSIDISATNHGIAQVIGFVGCITTGVPFDVTGSNTGSAGTTYSISSVNTTIPGEVILVAVAQGVDSSTVGSYTIVNSNLTSIVEQIEGGTSAGNGGQIGAGTGTLAGSGAVGATTGDLPRATSSDWAGWVGALLAPAVGPANLKSYNTNLKANIKSIDTNLIANIKSLDTNV